MLFVGDVVLTDYLYGRGRGTRGIIYKNLEGIESTATDRREEDFMRNAHFLAYNGLLAEYTTKNLTYSTDILRAFAGILHQHYGSRTFFGLPLDNFDGAVLRSPDMSLWNIKKKYCVLVEEQETENFPSWSWISSVGPKIPKAEDAPYALAYWCRVLSAEHDPENEAASSKNCSSTRTCESITR